MLRLKNAAKAAEAAEKEAEEEEYLTLLVKNF